MKNRPFISVLLAVLFMVGLSACKSQKEVTFASDEQKNARLETVAKDPFFDGSIVLVTIWKKDRSGNFDAIRKEEKAVLQQVVSEQQGVSYGYTPAYGHMVLVPQWVGNVKLPFEKKEGFKVEYYFYNDKTGKHIPLVHVWDSVDRWEFSRGFDYYIASTLEAKRFP